MRVSEQDQIINDSGAAIILGLRLKLARDTAKCFGANSDVAIFLDKKFKVELEVEKLEIRGTRVVDISAVEISFGLNMKAVLSWAGLTSGQIAEAKIGEMI